MSFISLLNKTCTIQTNTPSQDSSGQKVESWANTTTGVACRIEPIGGGLQRKPTEVFEAATHTLFLIKPSTPTIITKDHRIVISSDNYKILLVQELYADVLIDHLEIILELIT